MLQLVAVALIVPLFRQQVGASICHDGICVESYPAVEHQSTLRREPMTWPFQKLWLSRSCALLMTVLIVTACSARTPTPASATFSYAVRVEDEGTSKGIGEASVRIDIPGGKPPLKMYTDASGFATFSIDVSYTNQSALLTVDATGYRQHKDYVNLTKGALPHVVHLRLETVPPISTPETPAWTPSPTSAPSTPLIIPTATETEPPPPTPKPTQHPRLTPSSDTARAIMPAGIFAAPDANSATLGGVSEGEEVLVLGRSAHGQWFYVRDDRGVEGFAYAPRFAWDGDYESLPKVPAPWTPSSPPTPTYTPTPLTPTTLKIDLWQLPSTGRCERGWWYMSVYIRGQGGDGAYTYYWNGEEKAGPLSGEYTFELCNPGGAIVGTGKVVSGDGQVAEKDLYIEAPDCSD